MVKPKYYVVTESFKRDKNDSTAPSMFVFESKKEAEKFRMKMEFIEFVYNDNEQNLRELFYKGVDLNDAMTVLREQFEETFDKKDGYYRIKKKSGMNDLVKSALNSSPSLVLIKSPTK